MKRGPSDYLLGLVALTAKEVGVDIELYSSGHKGAWSIVVGDAPGMGGLAFDQFYPSGSKDAAAYLTGLAAGFALAKKGREK